MGDRTPMAASQLHDSLRGAAGCVSLHRPRALDAGSIPPCSGSHLGSGDSGNPSAFSLQPSAFSQCLVRGTRRLGNSGFRFQVCWPGRCFASVTASFSREGVHEGRHPSSRVRSLVPSVSRSQARHPRLQVGSLGSEGQPLMSSSQRLCASAGESVVPQ